MFRLASRSLKTTRISSLSASRSLSFSSSKHVGALIRSTTVCAGVQQPRSTPLFARTGVPMRSYSTDNVYRSVWDRRNTNEFQTSLRRLVKVLSEQGEWWAAEAFIPTEDGTLKPSKVFKTLRGAQWRQKHKELLAERNSLSEKVAGKSSAINQAFESGEAQWLTSSNNEFVNGAGAERQSFASNIDAKTVFVQPIRVEGKTVAVVAFYAPDVRPRNDAMIKHARHTIRGLLEAGLSHDDTAAPFQEEDYRELVDPADNPAPVQIMNEVFGILSLQGVFSDNVVYAEIDWFFRHLQLDAAYFRLFSTDEVAQHIELLIAAKRMASAAGRAEHITLDAELENGGSIHVVPNDEESVDALEARFEKMFHEEEESGENVLSLSMFRSKRSGLVGGNLPLLVYIVHRSKFSNKNVKENETDLNRVATDLFLETKPEYVSKHYLDVISTTADRLSPTLKIVSDTSSGGKQVMFCFREDKMTMHKLSEMVSQQGLHLERKFVERFANGMRVYSMFLSPTNQIEDKIATLIHTTSLLHTLPRNNELLPHFLNKTLTAEQYAYAAAVSRFMFYFITKQSEDYQHLLKAFQKVNDEENIAILTNLHARLRTAAVSPARIMDCVANHLPIIKELYNDFRRVSTDVNQKPSFNKDLASKIKKAVSTEIDERILNAFVNFNAHVVKTNFFCSKKVSLSFRLDDTFIPQGEVIERPYAIFLVLGPTFQGFHVRFRDVSRGGIRLIPFTNPTAYLRNEASQFNENFALAYTQNQKNKDIPEFGSKGTVLMDPAAPRTPAANQHAFQHYVSGLLDLIVPNDDSVHRDVKVKADHLGHEELLFLGPDENTADFMQWAALYARYRGYRHWKSITTGKPPSLGGIPHDTYGMTTRSVHQYVMGVLNKLGLQESQVTKLQTGGPDGDLGSNEIFLSHDRTTSIVDGSGVLYDPNGLDRDELTRLAKERRMCSHFNTSALGDGGFFISVDARDVTLPNGELVESGLQFRNEFHLHPLSSADLFVPCGGRPEAINIDNVHRMFDEEGNPRFKIIVEGANLFLTQDARLRLERAGVILYRDASANKGGVTSSSLEVLAALSLTDAEFGEHMCVEANQTPPKFYSDYVIDVQNIIEENARLEFECIWKEHQSSGAPRSILTTKVSDKINLINDFITKSSLYDDADVRRAVMARAMPKTLVNLVGLDELLDNRVPASYSRALFSCYVASRYVYKYGLNSPEVAFFEFMRTLTEKK